MGAQFHYILHGPLAEPHEYADPTLVECEARHCLTAADLRSIDGGRVAEWAAAQPASKVAPVVRVRVRVRIRVGVRVRVRGGVGFGFG